MEILRAIVLWLEGKKVIIMTIVSLVISYLVTIKTVTPELGTLLQSILSLLAGGAVAIGSTKEYKKIQKNKKYKLPLAR